MGEPPEGLTLGRIDNDKGYEPSNCRWETWKEQAQNRRKGGKPVDPNSLRQKAIAAGLPYSLVYQRIAFFNWDEQKALTTPAQPKGRQIGWRKQNDTLQLALRRILISGPLSYSGPARQSLSCPT